MKQTTELMHRKKKTIGVFAFGDVPALYLKVIDAHLSAYLKLEAEIIPSLALPDYALNEHRFQYDCGIILKRLRANTFKGYEKVIGVLPVDLFVPIFTYVYGEARQGGKLALVSTFRLRSNPPEASEPSSLIFERTAKVAMHEVGHLFNLMHCDDEKCLMHFSGSLNELDRTPVYFCRYCTAYFHDALNPKISLTPFRNE